MTVASAQIAPDAKPPARIVIAEDDPDIRELVAECLRLAGYEVVEVPDGRQLLVRIEYSLFLRRIPERVDLFVTDINMPGYTGLEVIRGLREAGMEIPVIIMSAFASAENRAEAKALGAAFLPKPFDAKQLRALVRDVLDPAPVNP
jgi:DNA-binding response OmpR family regulator